MSKSNPINQPSFHDRLMGIEKMMRMLTRSANGLLCLGMLLWTVCLAQIAVAQTSEERTVPADTPCTTCSFCGESTAVSEQYRSMNDLLNLPDLDVPWEDWDFTDSHGTSHNVKFRVTNTPGASNWHQAGYDTNHAMYIGDPYDKDFQSSYQRNYATALSPVISLPADKTIRISWSDWHKVEEYNWGPWDNCRFYIRVVETGQNHLLVRNWYGAGWEGGNPYQPKWTFYEFDISEFAGQDIQVFLSFDTIDGIYNRVDVYGQRVYGWFVDDILLCADQEMLYFEDFELVPTVGRDIELTERISTAGKNEVQDSSFTLNPNDILSSSSTTTLNWLVSRLRLDETLDIDFDVTLNNLEPEDQRLVSEGVTLSYTNIDDELITETLGPESVDIKQLFEISIDADKDIYIAPDIAKLTTHLQMPLALDYAYVSKTEQMQAGVLDGLDATTSPGQLILKEDQSGQYLPSGTATYRFESEAGKRWGNLTFTATEASEVKRLADIQSQVQRVASYDRTKENGAADGWWNNVNASWYQQAADTVVDHALDTRGGGLATFTASTALTTAMDERHFSIEGWMSGTGYLVSRGGVMFYESAFFDIEKTDSQIIVRQGRPDYDWKEFEHAYDYQPDASGWDHIVLTVQTNVAKIYVNGNLAGQWSWSSGWLFDQLGDDWYIGASQMYGYPNDYMIKPEGDGNRIDEVRFYDRQLTDSEVALNHTRGRNHESSQITNGLLGWWSFDLNAEDTSDVKLGGVFMPDRPVYEWGNAEGDIPGRLTARNSDAVFPTHAIVSAHDGVIDIVDIQSNSIWIRLDGQNAGLWPEGSHQPNCFALAYGKLVIGQNDANSGIVIVDFVQDQIRAIDTTGLYVANETVSSGTSPTYPSTPTSSTVKLTDGHIQDILINAANTHLAVATQTGVDLILNESSVISHTGLTESVTRLTEAGDDLYCIVASASGDQLHAIYDYASLLADFTSAVSYGGTASDAQQTNSMLNGSLNDLFAKADQSTVHPLGNRLYLATDHGLVILNEYPNDEDRVSYSLLVNQSATVDENDETTLAVLEGTSDHVVAVDGDDQDNLWVATMGDTESATIGALSIWSESDATRRFELQVGNASTDLPNDSIADIAANAIGMQDKGIICYNLGMRQPVAFRTRSALTEAALANATWSDVMTQSGSNIESEDLPYLEVELTMQSDDPTITPHLDSFSIGINSDSVGLDVTIEDEAGNRAAKVATVALTDSNYGSTADYLQDFDTSLVVPQNYRARATVVNRQTGVTLGTATDDFEVQSQQIAQTALAGTISADKREYAPANPSSSIHALKTKVPIHRCRICW